MIFQNRCAQTVWPGFGRTCGRDQSKADDALWAPIEAGATHAATVHAVVQAEIALWGRTGCTFDAQGVGHCETGDCGGVICATEVNVLPADATMYAHYIGYRSGYNLPMTVDGACCGPRACSYDLKSCPADAQVLGGASVIGCKADCDVAGACCRLSPNGCYGGGDITVTFCP